MAFEDPTFPQPVANFGGGRGTNVWYWPEVAAWGVAKGRLPSGSEREVPTELLSRPLPAGHLQVAHQEYEQAVTAQGESYYADADVDERYSQLLRSS